MAGPNGAGKTTLLKLVAGFLKPTRGSVRVLGLDPRRARAQVMRDVRFAFAPPALYDRLNAREQLAYLARMGGGNVSDTQVEEALELVGLRERAADPVGQYSFGMRQRFALAQALVPRPRLIVLDEPTDGLDPLAICELRGVLAQLRETAGVSVLLSSHLMIELDQLVDELVVLESGDVLFQGPPQGLRGAVEVTALVTSDDAAARELLAQRGWPVESAETGLVLRDSDAALEDVRAQLNQGGLTLLEFSRQRPSLEEALLARLRERAEERR